MPFLPTEVKLLVAERYFDDFIDAATVMTCGKDGFVKDHATLARDGITNLLAAFPDLDSTQGKSLELMISKRFVKILTNQSDKPIPKQEHLCFATRAMRNFLDEFPHLENDVEKMMVHARDIQVQATRPRKSLDDIVRMFKDCTSETFAPTSCAVKAFFLYNLLVCLDEIVGDKRGD